MNFLLVDENKTAFFHKQGATLAGQAVTTHLGHWEGTDININDCSPNLVKNGLCFSQIHCSCSQEQKSWLLVREEAHRTFLKQFALLSVILKHV